MLVKSCDTKRAFMFRLRNKLIFTNRKSEVISILKDYEEFFEVGISEGKTEKELCAEFGDPQVIINELNSESSNLLLDETLLKRRLILKYFVGFFLIITLIISLISVFKYGITFELSMLILPIFVLGIWFILSGMFINSSNFLHGINYKSKFKDIYFIIILILINVSIFIFMNNTLYMWSIGNGNPFNIPISSLGFFVMVILHILVLINLIIAFVGLGFMYTYSLLYYSTFIVSLGSILSFLCYIKVMRTLANISEFKQMIFVSILPFLFSLFISLLFNFYFKLRYKEEYI